MSVQTRKICNICGLFSYYIKLNFDQNDTEKTIENWINWNGFYGENTF